MQRVERAFARQKPLSPSLGSNGIMRAWAIGTAAVLLATLLGGCTGPATGGIRGIVVDEHARPIAGVIVRLNEAAGVATNEAAGVATTTATGSFEIAGLAPGTYTLWVSGTSYRFTTVEATVVAGAWTEVTIPLEPFCTPGSALPVSVVTVVASGLAFDPEESTVALGDVPFTLRVENGNDVPHKFHYAVVQRNGSRVLFEADTVVAPRGNKMLQVPVWPGCDGDLDVGGMRLAPADVEVLFEEPDLAAAGMTGRITFKA
jgi:hypothetical protein